MPSRQLVTWNNWIAWVAYLAQEKQSQDRLWYPDTSLRLPGLSCAYLACRADTHRLCLRHKSSSITLQKRARGGFKMGCQSQGRLLASEAPWHPISMGKANMRVLSLTDFTSNVPFFTSFLTSFWPLFDLFYPHFNLCSPDHPPTQNYYLRKLILKHLFSCKNYKCHA